MTGKEMADSLLQFVNSFAYDSKGFSKEICETHRTLQQCSAMRLFVEKVQELAQNGTDDRNKNG